MFDLGAPLWQIALRALAVYAAVFLGFRVLGKRELGQMTVFDLVLILLLSNAVQNAMVGAVLVEHGKLVTGQLRRQGVAEEDLAMAMREHGIASLDDVQLAVLETDGSISIVPASSPTLRSHRRRARALRRK